MKAESGIHVYDLSARCLPLTIENLLCARCVREAVRFSTTPTLAAVSNAWPQRGGMRLTGRPRRPVQERERGREPGDRFEWVAFQTCSE